MRELVLKYCQNEMRMRTQKRILAAVWLIAWSPIALSMGEDGPEKIRDFSLPAIEKLGQELFERDALSSAAFDLLFETHPEAREQSLGGWITELGQDRSQVYLLKRTEEEIRQAYLAVFEKDKEPRIESRLDEPLPEQIARRFEARSAAIQAIPGFYDRPYNFEVLDDSDGGG
ncbi:MAG: hypothetical protein AAF491_10405, partial [Verrucomicrobiota bacterium]